MPSADWRLVRLCVDVTPAIDPSVFIQLVAPAKVLLVKSAGGILCRGALCDRYPSTSTDKACRSAKDERPVLAVAGSPCFPRVGPGFPFITRDRGKHATPAC